MKVILTFTLGLRNSCIKCNTECFMDKQKFSNKLRNWQKHFRKLTQAFEIICLHIYYPSISQARFTFDLVCIETETICGHIYIHIWIHYTSIDRHIAYPIDLKKKLSDIFNITAEGKNICHWKLNSHVSHMIWGKLSQSNLALNGILYAFLLNLNS